MKISYNWLHDFVDLRDLGLDPEFVSQALASVGLAVEGIDAWQDDSVFNIDVTSNRPDCLSHLGVARELAAHFRLKLRVPDLSEPAVDSSVTSHPAAVVIEAPDLCPLYSARVLTSVEVAESPVWLKERLLAVGQRPINNIVDITNYVLLLLGHPLHAFDYEKLEGRRIVVRRPRPGESVVTLDGVERALDPSMAAICDAVRPVAVAGVMGGQNSEISLNTHTILLESAYFTPSSIRSTSRALGLRTEASYRFERGADPAIPVKALHLACRLIEEVAGGRCAGPVLVEDPIPFGTRSIELRPGRIRQVVGIDIDGDFVTDILGRLDFQCNPMGDGGWKVSAPGFRVDVGLEDDLVEEVARHYGYDKIPSTYPAPKGAGEFLPTRPHEQTLVQAFRGFGFYEAVNYVFSTPEREGLFFGRPTRMVAIANPLTEEDTHLRTSLLPGLVANVRHNLNHGTRDVRLFEFGKVFAVPEEGGDASSLSERPHLGMVATGSFYRPFWAGCREDFGFFHLKGIAEELVRLLGFTPEFEKTEETGFLHPGAGVRILIEGRQVGFLGELSPELHEAFKFLQKVFVGEVDLTPFLAKPLAAPGYLPFSRYPGTERDLSFVVDKGVEYGRIATAIKSLHIDNLRDVQVVDLYQGQKLPSSKVSLTVRLTFADLTRTLTQEEVNRHMTQVAELLRRDFDAEQRT